MQEPVSGISGRAVGVSHYSGGGVSDAALCWADVVRSSYDFWPGPDLFRVYFCDKDKDTFSDSDSS